MNQVIEQLIHDMLHGHASSEDIERLSTWIAESKDNARAYYRVLSDERAIERCLEQDATRAVSQLSDESDDSSAGFVLAELAQAEANAEASMVELVRIKPRMQFAGLKKYGWAALIAIATLTAVVVTLLVGPNDAPTSSPVAEGPRETVPTTPVQRQNVATLTATHNAQWAQQPAERVLARGSQLRVGDKYTLTAGFAEITTHRGAIAILEAPATIELIDNANALHLHTGKLVGICETDSSKGFLVRTRHMDVTDLGTRFGIETTSFVTEVHVFEGEVQAARPDAPVDTKPITLTANQSARTSADTAVIARIDHDAAPFAALRPQTIQLPGTGLGLAVGDTDPNWQIVAIDGQPLDTPMSLTVSNAESYYTQYPMDPATSQFIAVTPTVRPPRGGSIDYTFQTRLTLPEDYAPDRDRLAIRFMADNEVTAVLINGKRIPIKDALYVLDYDNWSELTLAEHLMPGANTIAFEVRNHFFESLRNAGPVGLRVQWELRTQPRLIPLSDTERTVPRQHLAFSSLPYAADHLSTRLGQRGADPRSPLDPTSGDLQ